MKHCKFLNTALDRLTFHQQGITEPFGFLVLDSRKTLKNLQLCVSYSRIAALVGECQRSLGITSGQMVKNL